MTMKNITSGFRVTGIYPVNRNALVQKENHIDSSLAELSGLNYIPLYSPAPQRVHSKKDKSSFFEAFPSATSTSHFTAEKHAKFEKRYENGYDLHDSRYNQWKDVYYPSGCSLHASVSLNYLDNTADITPVTSRSLSLSALGIYIIVVNNFYNGALLFCVDKTSRTQIGISQRCISPIPFDLRDEETFEMRNSHEGQGIVIDIDNSCIIIADESGSCTFLKENSTLSKFLVYSSPVRKRPVVKYKQSTRVLTSAENLKLLNEKEEQKQRVIREKEEKRQAREAKKIEREELKRKKEEMKQRKKEEKEAKSNVIV